MAKIGRNDPCPCGSGKKYKQCHGPIEEAREREQRQIKQAQDTLLPKVMDAAPRFAGQFLEGLQRFWNGKYDIEAIEELDDLETRGTERFLTWFMFDCSNQQELTPIARLAVDPSDLDLTPAEATVLPTWTGVRLQPYLVVDTKKNSGVIVRPLWAEHELFVDDYAASRRVEAGEVLIMHLTPTGDAYHVAGMAAQLTGDIVSKIEELAAHELENLRTTKPDATYTDLIRDRSEIFNHIIMDAPHEEQEPHKLQQMIDQTRVMMALTAQSLGLRRDEESEHERRTVVPRLDDEDDQPEQVDTPAGEEGETSAAHDLEITDITPRPLHTEGH